MTLALANLALSRLHTLPFDVIKLDKQFAQQIDHPMVLRHHVKAAIELLRHANSTLDWLIAEGVETHRTMPSPARTLVVTLFKVFSVWLTGTTSSAHWLLTAIIAHAT